MFFSRRRRLFVDFKLQGALVLHATLYWFYCLLSVSLIAFCWIIVVQRPATSGELFQTLWMNYGPALLGSLILFPIVFIDCLRTSNRFAGPMVRVQKAMKQLANGEAVEPISLRKDDYWREFAADFNRLLDQRTAPRGETRPSPAAKLAATPIVRHVTWHPRLAPPMPPIQVAHTPWLDISQFRAIYLNGTAASAELRRRGSMNANRS